MGFDKTPWFLAGNVQHPVEVARTMAYVACAGQEGVVGAEHLKVSQTSTPSMNLQVAVGACGIENRDTGGSFQMFTARHATPSTVSIGAAGGSPRYDMLVARVEDPYFPGSPWENPDPTNTDPAARANWDFTKLRVITNVPSTARTLADAGITQSAIPLALIAVPANATSIIQSNITDLRRTMAASAAAAAGDAVGTIKMFAGDTIPVGWLLCDGSTFDSTLYPTLGGVVGSKYGPPSGQNRYLPDFRRRAPIGTGPGNVLGSNEGYADPSVRTMHWEVHWDHSHTVPAHGHGHDLRVNGFTHKTNDKTAQGGNTDRLTGPASHEHTLAGGIANAGAIETGGASGGGLHVGYTAPHIAIHFIIKAA